MLNYTFKVYIQYIMSALICRRPDCKFGFINCGHFILGMKPELLAVLKLNSPFSVKVGPVLLPLSWNPPSCDRPPLQQTEMKPIDHWLL